MRTNYSNIRYHIYRELSKIQQTKKNERSQLIDEITVPIFSGVISASVAGIIQREISNMFLFIPIISFVFLLLLFLSKWSISIYRDRIKPHFCPLKDQSQMALNSKAESLAAKFNYEVTYLASTAYNEILKKENRIELRNLKILDTCFYVNNAIRKLQEALFSFPYPLNENYVSKNKIEAVTNVIYATICELRGMHNLPEAYEAEISGVQKKYDDTVETIDSMYELKVNTFKGHN